jgi:1,4-alpha-glucan branching enzyme
MGQDFGQREEWSETRSLDWYLLEDHIHADIKDYVKKLLHLYKDNPVMYGYETTKYDCFRWINCDDNENSVFSFIRKKPDTFNDSLVFACNFTPIERKEYVIGVPNPGEYEVILSSDDVQGTKRVVYKAEKMPENIQQDYFDYKLTIDLKGFESIVMTMPKLINKPKRRNTKKKKK